MAGSFADRLRAGPPVVADGGMGVVLSDGVPGLRCPEEANLRAPDAVVAVHVSFINAGAELIETNTFGANRRKLAQHFLEDDFERINSTAKRARSRAVRCSSAGRSDRRPNTTVRRSPSRRGSWKGAAPTL
jgi:homocysteine S-methyltransferase